jgi:predicted DNA-binding transcriptional regulator YafY
MMRLVGQRSRTETVVAVFAALMQGGRSWTQAELARVVGVRPEALRKILEEMVASGIPLDSEKDHPHVYWSVPKTFFPGGVLFPQAVVPDLLRQLRRLPRSKSRDRLLGMAEEQVPARTRPSSGSAVTTQVTPEQEQEFISLVEDAAAKKIPLAMTYHTASRGKTGSRHASVHLVDAGPPARFVATCHRNGDLRWFRVGNVFRARLDEQERFREPPPGAVDSFCAASLDGYKGPGNVVECSFFVHEPDSNWVANNLLPGMNVESLHDGIRVRVKTSALLRLARFVVSLGRCAQPETATLAEAVAELARGALEQAYRATGSDEGSMISVHQVRGPGQLRSDV